MKKSLATIILGSALVLNGCKPKTFETELQAICQNDYKMTQEEAQVAVVKGERDLFLTQYQKEGKNYWKPNYNAMTIQERLKHIQEMASDISGLLSYQEEENTRFIDEFQIREQLEKDEKAILFNEQKYSLVSLHQQFGQLMGLTEKEVPQITEAMLLYPLTPMELILEFDARYVQEARKAKLMVPYDDFSCLYKFDEEIPNPEYPHKDKTKATIRVPRQVALHIVSYDLDFPRDYRADYIEVFRGAEKKPAIKIFHSASSSSLDVAVVDSDTEGERGYGIPDSVDNISNVNKASDVYDFHRELLVKIFQEKKKVERTKPIEKEMEVQIVKVGELENDSWDYDKINGFTVPFTYDSGQNYTLTYKFKPSKKKNNERHVRQINWVAKRWLVPGSQEDINGRVVTYHRIAKTFGEKDVLGIEITDHRMIVTRLGKEDVSGDDSFFIEKEPYKITYDWGTSRWTLEDKDSKPPRYEARLEQTKPFFHELDDLKNGDGEESVHHQ